MSAKVRTLASGDLLLGLWCNECMRPFHVGEEVIIEPDQAARHVVCGDCGPVRA